MVSRRLGLAGALSASMLTAGCAYNPNPSLSGQAGENSPLMYEETMRKSPRHLEPIQVTQVDILNRSPEGFFREYVVCGLDYHQPKDGQEDKDYDIIAIVSPIAYPSIVPLISSLK